MRRDRPRTNGRERVVPAAAVERARHRRDEQSERTWNRMLAGPTFEPSVISLRGNSVATWPIFAANDHANARGARHALSLHDENVGLRRPLRPHRLRGLDIVTNRSARRCGTVRLRILGCKHGARRPHRRGGWSRAWHYVLLGRGMHDGILLQPLSARSRLRRSSWRARLRHAGRICWMRSGNDVLQFVVRRVSGSRCTLCDR
jgi:hypothetical protein